MNIEEYRKLWQEAIHLCEMEPNEDVAMVFIKYYCSSLGNSMYASMDNEELLLTFVKLVVFEQKFHIRLGSTTPTKFCYRELLARADDNRIDREFIYDVGDWAADYSDNSYVPMDGGGGPRQHFAFWHDYASRVAAEKQAKEERLEKTREEGRIKVAAAKRKQLERIDTIQQLKEKSVDECLAIIEQGEKPVFYYYELIEEWFKSGSLSSYQREKILSMFPSKSTRLNNKMRKYLETL